MTLNKLAFSIVGSLALASTGFAGTAPVKSAKGCTSCCTAPASDDLGVTLGVGYDSSYIFRGLNLADNWITASVDWSLPLTDKVRFQAGATYGSSADDGFANSLLDQAGLGGIADLSYQRLELNAGIVADLGGVDLGLGYRWYHQMGDGSLLLEDGHEVGLTLATKVGPLNVGIGGYYDFEIDGWYFELGVNSEIKLNDTVSLVPGVTVGYGVDYTYHIKGISGIDGFSHVGLSLALPIKLTKSATLTPYIAGNLPIDELDGLDNELIGGASLTVKF